jgi:putative endonuclease
MYYTYILRSIKNPGAIYIGYTSDLKSRLAHHNGPHNHGYTKRHAPWDVETYVAFSEEMDAKRFEVYLKSSSGKAFMKKRLISSQFKKNLEEFNNNRNK